MKYGCSPSIPKGVKASDGSGEKSGRLVNGVAMGKKDGTTCKQKTGEHAKSLPKAC